MAFQPKNHDFPRKSQKKTAQKPKKSRIFPSGADFFLKNNCDKCVPCREGVYRIAEMLDKREIYPVKSSLSEFNRVNKKTLEDIFFVLEETSFCALGKGVVAPFRSLIKKIL